MLIINDIDIIGTDVGRINRHSINAEPYQQLNGQTTSPLLQTLSEVQQSVVQSKCLSMNSFDTKHVNDESMLKRADHAMSISISQLNEYNNR